ncbi:hypothetical protein D3C83_190640 [compost metagenome]
MFVWRETKWNRGVEGGGGVLALPVERGGVADFDDPGADRVEHLERRNDLAGGMDGDL